MDGDFQLDPEQVKEVEDDLAIRRLVRKYLGYPMVSRIYKTSQYQRISSTQKSQRVSTQSQKMGGRQPENKLGIKLPEDSSSEHQELLVLWVVAAVHLS